MPPPKANKQESKMPSSRHGLASASPNSHQTHGVYFTGFTQACLGSIIKEGGACRSLSITDEILTADSLWGMGNHCLQLCSTLEQIRLEQLASIVWSLRWPWLHSVHHQINRQKLGMNIQRKDRGESQRHAEGASNHIHYICA